MENPPTKWIVGLGAYRPMTLGGFTRVGLFTTVVNVAFVGGIDAISSPPNKRGIRTFVQQAAAQKRAQIVGRPYCGWLATIQASAMVRNASASLISSSTSVSLTTPDMS